jgi:hypothetical protein
VGGRDPPLGDQLVLDRLDRVQDQLELGEGAGAAQVGLEVVAGGDLHHRRPAGHVLGVDAFDQGLIAGDSRVHGVPEHVGPCGRVGHGQILWSDAQRARLGGGGPGGHPHQGSPRSEEQAHIVLLGSWRIRQPCPVDDLAEPVVVGIRFRQAM